MGCDMTSFVIAVSFIRDFCNLVGQGTGLALEDFDTYLLYIL